MYLDKQLVRGETVDAVAHTIAVLMAAMIAVCFRV